MHFEPVAWAARIEATIVAALSLNERPCRLATAIGAYKGEAASLSARVYGGDAIAYARFVSLTGAAGLEIANVLCVGHPQRALPILGVDMVKLGSARPPLLVADAWPTDAVAATQPPALEASPAGGWWQRFSSPNAVLMRVPQEETARAHDQLATLVEGWQRHALGSMDGSAAMAGRARVRSNEYLEAHREEDQTLTLLAKIFGDGFARQFIADVMFPPLGDVRP